MQNTIIIRGLTARFVKANFLCILDVPKMLKNVIKNDLSLSKDKPTLNALLVYYEDLVASIESIVSFNFPVEVIYDELSSVQKKAVLIFFQQVLNFWKYNFIAHTVLKDFMRSNKNLNLGTFPTDHAWLISSCFIDDYLLLYKINFSGELKDHSEYVESIKVLLKGYKPILKIFHESQGFDAHLGQKEVILKDYSNIYLEYYIEFRDIDVKVLKFLYEELKDGLDLEKEESDVNINHLKKEFKKIVDSKKYDDYCSDPSIFVGVIQPDAFPTIGVFGLNKK